MVIYPGQGNTCICMAGFSLNVSPAKFCAGYNSCHGKEFVKLPFTGIARISTTSSSPSKFLKNGVLLYKEHSNLKNPNFLKYRLTKMYRIMESETYLKTKHFKQE